MDKNTITGLVLIGILLVGFSFLSRPSEEQIAAQKRYYDSIAVVKLTAKKRLHRLPILLLCFSMPCMGPILKSASRIM